jgi:hypothetical protein
VNAEVSLRAENDQLRSALREALRLTNVRALGVVCGSCGSKVGRSCYGNGPMAEPHGVRTQTAESQVKVILLEALGISVTS